MVLSDPGGFFRDGEFHFPDDRHGEPEALMRADDGTYRTVFGPSVAHNGVIYGRNDNNMALAFRRVSAAREGDLAYHNHLYQKQTAFLHQHRAVFDALAEKYAGHFLDFVSAAAAADDHHADPHQKRELRIQAYAELVDTGDVHQPLWVQSIAMKFKKDEWAKPNKIPRLIADLGVAASLQGFAVTGLLKEAMAAETFVYRGITIQFCKSPATSMLREVFHKLLNPLGVGYFVYFSDDSCFSFRDASGKITTYNMDIKKCDASHGPTIFDALQWVTPERVRPAVSTLVDQCRLPITVRSVHDKRHVVKLQANRPKLYSGSTITTSINNLANMAIAIGIADRAAHAPIDPQLIHAAAADTGYLLNDLEPATQPHDIQFLKHSPAFDTNGDMQPLLNFGVLLRASGTCKGDLPGRGDIETRARRFQGGLIHGMFPRVDAPVLRTMLSHTLPPDAAVRKTLVEQLKYTTTSDEEQTLSFTDEEMLQRYRLTPYQFEDLLYGLDGGFETSYACSGSAKVLELDYGGLSSAYNTPI